MGAVEKRLHNLPLNSRNGRWGTSPMRVRYVRLWKSVVLVKPCWVPSLPGATCRELCSYDSSFPSVGLGGASVDKDGSIGE